MPSVDLTAYPSHLAHVKKSGGNHIISGALSPDGSLLAFSDIDGVRCYQLQNASAESDAASTLGISNAIVAANGTAANGTDAAAAASNARHAVVAASGSAQAKSEAQHSLQRLSLPEDLPGFQEMHFRPDTSELVGLTAEGTILIVDALRQKVSSMLLAYTGYHTALKGVFKEAKGLPCMGLQTSACVHMAAARYNTLQDRLVAACVCHPKMCTVTPAASSKSPDITMRQGIQQERSACDSRLSDVYASAQWRTPEVTPSLACQPA